MFFMQITYHPSIHRIFLYFSNQIFLINTAISLYYHKTPYLLVPIFYKLFSSFPLLPIFIHFFKITSVSISVILLFYQEYILPFFYYPYYFTRIKLRNTLKSPYFSTFLRTHKKRPMTLHHKSLSSYINNIFYKVQVLLLLHQLETFGLPYQDSFFHSY